MVIRFLFFIFLLFFLNQSLEGQNLVPNPSFEKRNNIFYSKKLYFLSNWNSPNAAIPWLIRGGKSHFGVQKPYSGKNYVLIEYGNVVYGSLNYELFGCIQAKLKTKLDSGQMYCIELQSSLADNYNYAVPSIQVGFSSQKIINRESSLAISPDRLLQLQHNDSLLNDRINWKMNCTHFISNGTERFIQIGFLNEKTTMIKIPVNSDKRIQVGYFIDDVSLKKISDSTLCSCKKNNLVVSEKALLKKKSLVPNSVLPKLHSIYFDTDSFNITASNSVELSYHIEFLIQNENAVVQILGHTDSTGKEAHNIQLAEKRARQVANYLIKNGVDEKRVTIQVMSSKSPIGDNATKEGRKKNRRVSFRLKIEEHLEFETP